MRYRKRISLGGGTKLNLSKSGVSLSTGIKGLSVTTGKKGTYLNAGIPGTGIYDRVKISGSSTSKAKSRYQVDGDITDETSTTNGEWDRKIQTEIKKGSESGLLKLCLWFSGILCRMLL